ncbi:MAG TPA: FkbM family methyltransferase [Verrucomicrobiae bacterium]|jgi:FkbM family methyltransferase
MRAAFVREITRQHCFQRKSIPWILKIYGYPFHRWASPRRQALFGAPYFLMYFLYQRFWPFQAHGTFTYNAGTEKLIQFNPKNSQFHSVYWDLFKNGYEPQTTSLINLITPTNGVFYDIGSNWGWFSLSLAARSDFKGKIHAFEPFPGSYADLCSTVKQAGLEDRIQCHAMAISDQCGDGTMHMADGFSSGLAGLDEKKVEGRQSIKIASLDSLSFDPPDVMKVDVEGNEEKVFAGGKKLIEKHKPMIIFENVRAFTDVAGALSPIFFLNELGYVFYRLAWTRKMGQRSCYIGDDIEESVPDTELLTLVEFDPTERFVLADGGNIFACHKEKLPELQKCFQKL